MPVSQKLMIAIGFKAVVKYYVEKHQGELLDVPTFLVKNIL